MNPPAVKSFFWNFKLDTPLVSNLSKTMTFFAYQKIVHLARIYFCGLAFSKYFAGMDFPEKVFKRNTFSVIILDFDEFLYKKEKLKSMNFSIPFMKAENYYLWNCYI